MSRYDALAGSYDAMMTDASYQKRAKWLEKLFRRSKIPVRDRNREKGGRRRGY